MIEMGASTEFNFSEVIWVGYHHISRDPLEKIVHQECDSLVDIRQLSILEYSLIVLALNNG